MGKGTKKGGPEDWNLTDADEALLAAAQSGDLAAARAALDAGAKRECYSDGARTALAVAAGGGTPEHVAVMNLLLDRGCYADSQAMYRRTPLMTAAAGGHADAVRTLLARGANLEAKTDGFTTALHAAAESGQLDCMRVLLDAGANTEAKSMGERTPMHGCAEGGTSFGGDSSWSLACVRMLAEYGADVHPRDGSGLTPLSLAIQRGTNCVRFLEEAPSASGPDYGPLGEPSTVLHLTALRLFADEAQKDARGVAPAANVAAVLRAASEERARAPAAVIVTGDVAADRSAGAYALAKRLVRSAFPAASTKVLYLPGPGDDVAAMDSVFRPDFIGPRAGEEAPVAVALPLADSAPTGTKSDWRVVLMPPSKQGGLAASQLDALNAELKAATQSAAFLVLPSTLRPTAGCNGRSREEYGEPGSYGICSTYSVTDPVDPDPTCAFFDALNGVGGMVHAGDNAPIARRDIGGTLHDTPAACGGDADDARPGYRVVQLYPQGANVASHARRVKL